MEFKKGPVFHCNETHIPTMNPDIKQAGHMAALPAHDQGRFRGAETAGELTATAAGPEHGSRPLHGHRAENSPAQPVDHEYFLRKSYAKHGGEHAEIHGPLKSKFNGGRE